MNIYKNPTQSQWAEIIGRPTMDNTILLKSVGKILSDVKKGGDRAVRKYSKKFDGISPKKIKILEKEIKKGIANVPDELKHAIKVAAENIRLFHYPQMENSPRIETTKGVECWRKSVGIERVGIYIPGGSAPLFSTVLMLGIPAQIAGCKHVILCTPPSKDGKIHPAILYAASLVGISEIYACGGAQAIAAMAYGTESLKKVDKIFGPGNQYVTAAKQLVQLEGTAIDMPAGPSEVCVLADQSSNPAFLAADLLSQAEHGPDSQVLLVTTSLKILNDTIEQLNLQVKSLPRNQIAQKSIENSRAVLLENMDDALSLVNTYAAEHLIIASDDAEHIADKVVNAGSVFLGNLTPESAGDYASGTNHTLPTNGHARAYSGVSVDSFVRKITFQKITHEGIRLLGPTIIEMAQAEQLDAHANAVKIRLNQ
jgi:histidinol dehydrogenase